ncbi:CDAN1 protein, partial [Polypterus senegalus]
MVQNVRASDEGIYTCLVVSEQLEEDVKITLNVEVLGAQPSISMSSTEGQKTHLECSSEKWNPQPEVTWMDINGTDMTSQSTIKSERDSEGLLTVSSVLPVKEEYNVFSCLMRSKAPKPDWHSGLAIYSFSPGISGWLVAFCVLLILCLAATPLLFIQWRRMRADVTFDPESAHPLLIVSEDGKDMRLGDTQQRVTDNPKRFDHFTNVLAREGFTSGRHYWEVEVKEKTAWTLGVARESVNRKGGIILSPYRGYWTVGLRNENEYKGLDYNDVPLPLRVKPRTVGVFLDYDEGQVSFYNAQSRSHLYTFTDSFTGTLYPFFSPELNDGDSFIVVGPSKPVVSYVGEDVVLPASLSPKLSAEEYEVRWFTTDILSPVLLYQNYRIRQQTDRRKIMFIENLKYGNISLIIRDVHVSDDALYKCSVYTGRRDEEAHISFYVEGFSPGVSGCLLAFCVLLVLYLAATPLLFIQWRRMRADVTFDPETAHPLLIVSKDGKEVRLGDTQQRVTDNPKRFDYCINVLARKGIHLRETLLGSGGRGEDGLEFRSHQRVSRSRKGGIILNPYFGYWTVWLKNENKYTANIDHPVLLPLRVKPWTVGVFLDYDEGQDDGGIDGLASSGLQLKEFVPCLLNFLREQTSQILSHGPPTPAKTPNSKSLRTTVERGGAPQSSPTPSRGASRVQLFSPVPCSSPEAEVETPGSQSLSGITFFSSPSFTSSPMHRSYPEKRSAQRNSLGEFLTTSPDLHHGQRRGRRRSGPSCNGGGRPPSRNQDNEHSKWESPLVGGGRRIRTETSEICTDSPLNLNNLDDFPPILTASVSAGTKPSRRINPTPVSVERSFSKPKTCFTSTPVSQRSLAEDNADSLVSVSDCVVPMGLQEEREMLRRERSKMAQQISVPVTTALDPTTPTKLGCSRMRPSIPGDSACILADVNKVSYARQLDILAQLYCVCISENLVPNVFLELFFVLQLLTSRSCGILDDENGKTDLYKDVIETPFFRSVHNCVYFAVKVLQTNFEVLAYLDKCTLRLLADNERIGCFAPSLRDQLLAAHEKSIAKEAAAWAGLVSPVGLPLTWPWPPAPGGGGLRKLQRLELVIHCLQHVLRSCPSVIRDLSTPDVKDRGDSSKGWGFRPRILDIFYELLREWEDYHKEPGWEFDRALGSRIRVMVSQLNAAGNHCHFARLFQKQLLQLCKSPHSSRSGDASDLDVLGMLGTDNLSRLKRLQERFIQSQSITGPCPPPSFQGHQEFFRDFLLSAGSFQLNQHLMDNLCQQILQLDSSDIIGIDNTKEEGEGDVEQQVGICICFC